MKRLSELFMQNTRTARVNESTLCQFGRILAAFCCMWCLRIPCFLEHAQNPVEESRNGRTRFKNEDMQDVCSPRTYCHRGHSLSRRR